MWSLSPTGWGYAALAEKLQMGAQIVAVVRDTLLKPTGEMDGLTLASGWTVSLECHCPWSLTLKTQGGVHGKDAQGEVTKKHVFREIRCPFLRTIIWSDFCLWRWWLHWGTVGLSCWSKFLVCRLVFAQIHTVHIKIRTNTYHPQHSMLLLLSPPVPIFCISTVLRSVESNDHIKSVCQSGKRLDMMVLFFLARTLGHHLRWRIRAE